MCRFPEEPPPRLTAATLTGAAKQQQHQQHHRKYWSVTPAEELVWAISHLSERETADDSNRIP